MKIVQWEQTAKEITLEEKLVSAIILEKKKTQKSMHYMYKYESLGHNWQK